MAYFYIKLGGTATGTTRPDNILATGTAHHTDSTNVWTEALTTPVQQYEEILIPALSNVTNGNIDIYVNLALASTDVWVCPKVIISTAT